MFSCNLGWDSFELDFVEIYAGTAKLSRGFVQEGFRVGPPIDISLGWDLNADVFAFLLKLSSAGKVAALLWLSPPCSTF